MEYSFSMTLSEVSWYVLPNLLPILRMPRNKNQWTEKKRYYFGSLKRITFDAMAQNRITNDFAWFNPKVTKSFLVSIEIKQWGASSEVNLLYIMLRINFVLIFQSIFEEIPYFCESSIVIHVLFCYFEKKKKRIDIEPLTEEK